MIIIQNISDETPQKKNIKHHNNNEEKKNGNAKTNMERKR